MPTFKYKRNDTHTPHRTTLISRDGVTPENLSSVTSVTFKMRQLSEPTLKVNAAMAIEDAPNGIVAYTWAVGDTDTGGYFRGEYEVLYNDTTKETFPTVGHDTIIFYEDLDP